MCAMIVGNKPKTRNLLKLKQPYYYYYLEKEHYVVAIRLILGKYQHS